ncbi:MAG: Ppx/GppA family phosphatase [Aquificaceae bacterium]
MRVGVIDVGSYSCRLVVADVNKDKLNIVYEEGNITALGSGINSSGVISQERMEETIKVMRAYAEKARTVGASSVRVIGTEALRKARNANDFVQRVKAETNMELEIVSPEKEGRYAFFAVAYSLKPSGRFCIIDQGGGSTEFVCGTDFNIERLNSLPFGIVNLTEGFIHHDPPTLYELESLKDFLDEQISKVVSPCEHLLGLGGTITTLAALQYNVYPYKSEKVHGKTLTIDQVEYWLETLISMKEEKRISIFPHIETKRAKVIIPGIVIFYRSMVIFKKREITVSDWGLKEGVLVEYTM